MSVCTASVEGEAAHPERGTLASSWAVVVDAAEAGGLKVGVVSAVARFPMRQRGLAAEILHMGVVLADGRWADESGSRTERQVLDAHPAGPERCQAVALVTPAEALRLVEAALRTTGETVICAAFETRFVGA